MAHPQGLIPVAGPPQGAGRRGRVAPFDWDQTVKDMMENPHQWYLAIGVPAGSVTDLQSAHPNIEIAGMNHRVQRSKSGKETTVCELWLKWPKE